MCVTVIRWAVSRRVTVFSDKYQIADSLGGLAAAVQAQVTTLHRLVP
jgi:hypothetical protein